MAMDSKSGSSIDFPAKDGIESKKCQQGRQGVCDIERPLHSSRGI